MLNFQLIVRVTRYRRFATLLSAVFLSILFSQSAFGSQTIPDDSLWDSVLQQYVDDHGWVDYKSLSNNRESFDQYISSIQTVSPKSNPELYTTPEQSLAYYINAYNAMVFKGVLDRGPEEDSVWKGLISGLNFFVRMDITIGGEKTNLKALEDKVVRAQFKDPRIHAALNCASIGCPRLIREVYRSEKLEQQLDAAMREFLNAEMHVKVDSSNEKVGLSKIFDWYEDDFIEYETTQGNTDGSKDSRLIDFVNRYRSADNIIPHHYKVYILDYDKRINSRKG